MVMAKKSDEKSGDLREKQRTDKLTGFRNEPLDLRGDSSNSAPKDFRETMVAAVNKKKQERADKQGKAAKILAKPVSPIRKQTSKLLRQAWLNVFDSCGLTLLWVLAHWELNKLFGDQIFCPYGYEWADAVPEKGAEGQVTKSASNFLNRVESAGVGCLIIVILFGIITFLLFLCIIITGPTTIIAVLAWDMIKGFWDTVFG